MKKKNPQPNHFFPEFTPEETRRRIAAAWDLSGPVPVPRFEPYCPICRENHILLKECLFHVRTNIGSSNKFRCDVKFKCLTCSYVWAHGLVAPPEMAKKHEMNQIVHWRQIKRMIMSNE